MRKFNYFLAICLTLILGSMTLMVNAAKADDIKWQSYSNGVFEQAKRSNRLVLLYGKSDWCHWCQKMDANTWNDSAVIKAVSSHFIPVRVDVTDDADIATHYGVKGTPTLVIVDANKQVVKTLYGYEEPYDLVNNLDSIAQNYRAHR